MLLRKDGSGLYGHEKQPGMGQDWVFRVVVPSCVLFHLTDHLIDNFRLYCITFLLGQLPIINRFQFTFTFHLHCFMPSTRQKRKWSIQVNFKQQIDPRLGIYNQSPVVFAFFGTRKRVQPGHLKLDSCLHFLKQELGGPQVRYLQPASCLLSKMEVSTKAE